AVVGLAHAAKNAGRDSERLAERACERFERSVIGIQRDVGNPITSPREPPRGALQQQTTAHLTRSFIDESPEDTIKLGSAFVSETRQFRRAFFQIKRSDYGFRKSLVFAAVHK